MRVIVYSPLAARKENFFTKNKKWNYESGAHLSSKCFPRPAFPTPTAHQLSKNVAKSSKLNLRPNMQLPSLAVGASLAYPDWLTLLRQKSEDTCHVACQVAIFRGHFEAN